jgi:hypothetical protein
VFYPGRNCSVGPTLADSRTRRLFVAYSVDCSSTSPYVRFTVYEDGTPAATANASPQPDSYTQQVDEQPGVTTAQFGGDSQATGSRVRLIGGAAGFLRGASFGVYHDLEAAVVQALQSGGESPPDDATREVSMAAVGHASLDNYQSQSRATVAAVDDETSHAVADSTGQNATVPYVPLTCVDPGGHGGSMDYGADSSVSVSCDAAKHETLSTSKVGPYGLSVLLHQSTSGLPLAVMVGQSTARSHTFIDAHLGLVSDSTSAVRDVDIGLVHIDSVTASTHCVSHGRNGTASCTYARALNGVTITGGGGGGAPAGGSCVVATTPGGNVDTCGSLLAALNALQPGYLVFSMPQPDGRPDYLGGSPGGYQAVAQRELYEHEQDSILNYDSSQQVPGLEVLLNNDSYTSPSRLDLQLAGVESESHYGIQGASSLGDAFDTGGGAGEPSAGAPAAPGQPLATTTVTADGPPGAARPTVSASTLAAAGRFLQRIFAGISLLWRDPAAGMLTSLVLGVLVAPALLAWRRRRLLGALQAP